MPSTITVKVSEVGSTVRGDFNMVEIKGQDCANGKNVTKTCFETTKSGDLTKNAQIAQNLSGGDFVEMLLDDSSYKNLKTIKKVSAPAGGMASPSSGGGSSRGSYSGGGGSSDKMSKAEWAEKDRKKEVSMARHKAIQCSVEMLPEGPPTKKVIDSMEKLAYRIEAYILKGDFNAELDAEPEPAVAQTGNDDDPGNTGEGSDVPSPEDDDIPF